MYTRPGVDRARARVAAYVKGSGQRAREGEGEREGGSTERRKRNEGMEEWRNE